MKKFIYVTTIIKNPTTDQTEPMKAKLNADQIIIYHPSKEGTVIDTIKGTILVVESFERITDLIYELDEQGK